MDRYRSFAQLKRHERYGQDYRIAARKGASAIAVMAPHGGGIELWTDIIAQSIAHPDHTFWAFKGTKKTGNRVLHLTSTRFDVPEALTVATAAQTVITIHGCRGDESVVYVGGRDQELKSRIARSLGGAGFSVQSSPEPSLKGEKPGNLCNRCMRGRGVQLEITRGLRELMFTAPHRLAPGEYKTQHFFRFISAVRTALAPDR